MIPSPAKALQINPAHNSGTNKFLFLCVLLFPHKKKQQKPSFDCHLPPPPPFLCSNPPFSLPSIHFIHFPCCCFAAQRGRLSLLMLVVPSTPPPGPAMTVSFTRVSPVSSFSLRQSSAPAAWTGTQPQH